MAENDRPSVLGPVIGIALTGMFLLLIGYVVKRRTAEEAAVPVLMITTPQPNATVDSPLVVRFTSSVAVSLLPTGWGADGKHLHAWLDDTQLMPAASDIRKAGDSTYEWKFPGTPRGSTMRVRLGWADAAHRPIPEGASPEIPFSIR